MQQDIEQLRQWLGGRIVGQEHLIERLMIALLADGHLLVEGAPGLAKTNSIKARSGGLEASVNGVEFPPDLLPAGITVLSLQPPQKLNHETQPCLQDHTVRPAG